MKKVMIGFILGGIVFTLWGVVASTTISSNNVTYQNKTVNNALDELYSSVITGKKSLQQQSRIKELKQHPMIPMKQWQITLII